MTALITRAPALYRRLSEALNAIAGPAVPTLARFTFAAVLLMYFFNSAKTKLGDGVFGFLSPTDSAYIQIFPQTVEALGYDTSELGIFHWLVAVAGSSAELILPMLVVLGLLTRLASLGMIGFVLVQSFVDITGHKVGATDVGAWFDGASGSLVMDQRGLWVFVLLVLVLRGPGPLSLDRVLGLDRVGAGGNQGQEAA